MKTRPNRRVGIFYFNKSIKCEMKRSRVLKTCLNRAAVLNERLQVLNMFVLHIISGFYHSEKVSVNKIVVFVRFKEKFFVLFYVNRYLVIF